MIARDKIIRGPEQATQSANRRAYVNEPRLIDGESALSTADRRVHRGARTARRLTTLRLLRIDARPAAG